MITVYVGAQVDTHFEDGQQLAFWVLAFEQNNLTSEISFDTISEQGSHILIKSTYMLHAALPNQQNIGNNILSTAINQSTLT